MTATLHAIATCLKQAAATADACIAPPSVLGAGKVYRGRWKGAIVAVKVIDHRVQPGKTYDLSREPLLSMSVSHPNVVITHKVGARAVACCAALRCNLFGQRGCTRGLRPCKPQLLAGRVLRPPHSTAH